MEWGSIIGILVFLAVCYGGYKFYKNNLSDKAKTGGDSGSGSAGDSGTNSDPQVK